MAKILFEQLNSNYCVDDNLERYAAVIRRLRAPKGPVDVVLDTDTYNEIDDQYALVFLAESQDKLHVRSISAAPFHNHHSESAEDGMERSYQEILKVLELSGHTELSGLVHRGAREFLADERTPSDSEAARTLIDLAMEHTPEDPLYVACICAPTNIASALLLEPEIQNRIVVVWDGGVAMDWPDAKCFNGCQDVAATRVLLQSDTAIVLIPGRGVGYSFALSGVELEYWLRGRSPFCDYILDRTRDEARLITDKPTWSRQILDVLPIAWLLNGDFMLDRLEQRPCITYDWQYSFDPRRPMIRYVYSIKRDNVACELIGKLGHIPELLG